MDNNNNNIIHNAIDGIVSLDVHIQNRMCVFYCIGHKPAGNCHLLAMCPSQMQFFIIRLCKLIQSHHFKTLPAGELVRLIRVDLSSHFPFDSF